MEKATGILRETTSKCEIQIEPMLVQDVSLPQRKWQGQPSSKFQIIKNLVVVSLGFVLLYTSFQALTNVQSTINKDGGLGTMGLSIVFISLVVSCIFLPPILIQKLGCKRTMAVAMCWYLGYNAANFYARWATIVPSAILLGLGNAPLWTAQCSYITEIGRRYAVLSGQMEKDVINQFFGVFFFLFQTSQVWGNLFSSLTLNMETEGYSLIDMNLSDHSLFAKCGAEFCPGEMANNTNLIRPPTHKIFVFCGVALAFTVCGILTIIVCLSPLQLSSQNYYRPVELLGKSIKHVWQSKYQKLLVPISVYTGMEQAFVAGDYTVSFISCTLGVGSVGYVMICYGVVDSVVSLVAGKVAKYVGNIALIFIGFLCQAGMLIVLLVWVPAPSKIYIFYILVALWAVGDAVFRTIVSAMHGYLFPKEENVAFTVYRLCESVGWAITLGWSAFLCTSVKIYICFSVLCISLPLVIIVEILHAVHNERERRQVIK